LQLLSKALADTPARADARIPLFKAAESIHSDELALLAIDPFLRDLLLHRASPDENNDERLSALAIRPRTRGRGNASASLHRGRLSPAEQAQISLAVSNALVRLHRCNETRPICSSHKSSKGPARQKEIAGKLAEVRTVLRRERLNLAATADLHQELEQDRVVRPRLVARVATPASKYNGR